MPSEIKLWRIEDDKPKPVDPGILDLESRLERWLRQDIGLVSTDLLVIGQQVVTAYGGIIDLLAIDSDANLVVLELKKDMTPKDVVVQALDYASWVQNLDYESTKRLAEKFLADGKTLEQAFKEKFGDDLSEIINERHRIYIVASSLDSTTERMMQYLSETHGVDINAATFAYFKTPDGTELIGSSMLLDEETIKNPRGTRITPEELRDIAKENGVLDLWNKAFDEFHSISYGGTPTRGRGKQGRLFFRVRLDEGLRWFLSMYPGESSSDEGLSIEIQRDRITQHFSLTDDQISEVCGDTDKNTFDADRLDNLINLLKQNSPQT